MKQLFTILLTFFLFTSVFSQEKERFLGFNFTPGISDFYGEPSVYHEPPVSKGLFSSGFDLNYGINHNAFSYGIAFGIDILRTKNVYYFDSTSIVIILPEYIGLEYTAISSQYILHLSPFLRWNFITKDKFFGFVEFQPGLINRTFSTNRATYDYQAVHEDIDTVYTSWSGYPYKPVSFSLTGKLGVQYVLNEKYSLNFGIFYTNYLTSMIRNGYAGAGLIYYRYGIETGVKVKLN